MTRIAPTDLKGMRLAYREGFKYLVGDEKKKEDHLINLNLFLPFPGFVGEYRPPKSVIQRTTDGLEFVGNDYVRLYANGWMWFRYNYAWDGASGPTLDDKTNMRGSLYHDGAAQLSREGMLPAIWRDYFDKILKNTCVADGMPYLRAELWHLGVDRCGAFAFEPGYNPYPVQYAPALIGEDAEESFGFEPLKVEG